MSQIKGSIAKPRAFFKSVCLTPLLRKFSRLQNAALVYHTPFFELKLVFLRKIHFVFPYSTANRFAISEMDLRVDFPRRLLGVICVLHSLIKYTSAIFPSLIL